MQPTDRLDALLTEVGHPGRPLPEEELDYFEGEFALFGPLQMRGWLLRFDAEGDFFAEGAHSRVIRQLLSLAGVGELPQVRDTWLGDGWLFEIDDGERFVAHTVPSEDEEPSDYAELLLIASVVDAWLPEHTLLDLNTGDQTACLCVAPTRVYEALVGAGFIDPDREEGFHPQEDELVLPPGDELEEFEESVRKLDRDGVGSLLAALRIPSPEES